MKELNFEVSKFYFDGHGKKWECLKTDLDNSHPIAMSDGETVHTFTLDGYFTSNPNSINNIIGKWIEKPVVDWSLMPAWAKFVAMDNDSRWWWYNDKPIQIAFFWNLLNSGVRGFIPSEYAPKFNGDWTESLIERP